jgi:hypothetical protein
MRIFASDPTCFLIELADLERESQVDIIRQNLQPVTQIVRWAEEYLSCPHPQLGREGSVCPFVQSSMDKGLFFLTVWRGQPDPDQISEIILKYRDWFLGIQPCAGKEALYKTILILFPDISNEDAPRLIDATQQRLKADFVAKGLMIGQFHAGPPQEPGLWNAEFRPLNSPVPLLAIRHMVPSDFPFLTSEEQYVASYLGIYGHNVPEKLKELVRQSVLKFAIPS